MTSSNGPITGRNSGIRSIGDNTHSNAKPTATFARLGTRESRRRRRAVVTQSGRNAASSFRLPSGRRAASVAIERESAASIVARTLASSTAACAERGPSPSVSVPDRTLRVPRERCSVIGLPPLTSAFSASMSLKKR